MPEREEGFEEPVELAVAAISDALDGVTLSRDDLHEQLRRRLPKELLPWCEGCQSHHARRGLLVMASLRGRLCIAGRAGRQPAFARTDQHAGLGSARGRRGANSSAATCRLRTVDAGPLRRVGRDRQVARAKRLWVDDWAPPADPPQAEGVRLLATSDPLLLSRDRETVVPDPAMRKKVWTAVGGAGVVLVDGEVDRAVARPQAGQAARGHRRGQGAAPRAAGGGRAARSASRLHHGGDTSLRGVRNKDRARSTSTP